MDETPWDGLRFGALNPPRESVLSNYAWKSHRYRVTIGPNRTAIERDGKLQIEASAGVVFRNFNAEADSLSFTIFTVRPASVTIHEFGAGPASVAIDNLAAKFSVAKDGATIVTIPAGKHSFSGVWKRPAGSTASN